MNKFALMALISILLAAPAFGKAKFTMKNQYGPDVGECGEFIWQVNFELDAPSPKGGMFVQKVDYSKSVEDCSGGSIEKKEVVFWEAWTVSSQKTSPASRTKERKYDDKYSNPECEQRPNKGKVSIIGKVAFFEGKDLPSDFKMGNSETIAQGLPSSTTKPDFWDEGDALDHNLVVEWNCCNRKKKTHITKKTPEHLKKAKKFAPPERKQSAAQQGE